VQLLRNSDPCHPHWSIDVPSCNFGVSPTKNPDVTAGHGPSMMLDPTWFRLVSGGIS
jgi:hypothetical protein